ncbi:MAG: aldehyde ferredoxin oxidoreductase N-terminal domain-containing protein [Desulfobacteraceae bacterium]|jgi:aldehyde:ferredoxin oxidoreductase
MSNYGYAGEIIKVDLSDRSVIRLNTADYADRFLGGRGIGAKIYWDETSSKTKALAPDNCLVCTTGPIAGFTRFAGCRWQMCGKSPAMECESFSYANFGGSWGTWLKYAGFDGIAITGKSGNPSWILIRDNSIEINDAASLWGKTTSETEDYFKNTLGKEARVMCIGPAGENLISFAVVMASDNATGSGGFGSVMGSKNLKAVVILINKKKKPVASDPEMLKKLADKVFKLRTENYENYGHVELDKKRLKACYGCISGCDRQEFPDESGRKYKHFCQASAVYIEHAIEYNGLEKGLEVNRTANRLSDQYGLDTAVLMPLFDWLSACYKAGILTEEETGLSLSRIGSLEFVQELFEKISYRKGFGNILADGTIKAAKSVGRGSEKFISAVIGTRANETRDYDPRYMLVNALIYPFEPRRAIQLLHATSLVIARWQNNIAGFEDAYISPEKFKDIAREYWGSTEAGDFGTFEGKALAAKKIQDYGYMKESLVICDLAWPIYPVKLKPDDSGFSTIESKILSAITGRNIDEDAFSLIGERIFNLQRAIMIRQGSGGKEGDTIMDFYHEEPLGSMFKNPECIAPGKEKEQISRKGYILDRNDFEKLKSEYYILRGWDVETGFQTYAKLKELDMEDIALNLDKLGLLG